MFCSRCGFRMEEEKKEETPEDPNTGTPEEKEE